VYISGVPTNYRFHQVRQIDESWNPIKTKCTFIIYRLVSLSAQSDCKKASKPGQKAAAKSGQVKKQQQQHTTVYERKKKEGEERRSLLRGSDLWKYAIQKYIVDWLSR
jgi:hypothetical protein